MKLRKTIAAGLAAVLLLTGAAACGTASGTGSAGSTGSAEASGTSTQSGSTDSLLAKIKQRGYILVGSSNDAPFAYQDASTGKLAGLDIDILRAVCKKLGIPDIKMKVVAFENLLVELNNGNIDMVTDAMYVKEDRMRQAAFSDKWYQEGEAVVIPKNSSIQSKADLKDKTVGAQPGTTFYETAQSWLKAGKIKNLVSFDNQATLMSAVNMGKVDAVVTDGIVASYTISKSTALSLKLLSPYEPEASGQIGSAVRFSDESFLTDFSKALNDLKADGTIKKILAQYKLPDNYFIDADAGKTKNLK